MAQRQAELPVFVFVLALLVFPVCPFQTGFVFELTSSKESRDYKKKKPSPRGPFVSPKGEGGGVVKILYFAEPRSFIYRPTRQRVFCLQIGLAPIWIGMPRGPIASAPSQKSRGFTFLSTRMTRGPMGVSGLGIRFWGWELSDRELLGQLSV